MGPGFSEGFRSGMALYNSAQQNKRDQEEMELRKQHADLESQLIQQQIAAGERAARRDNALEEETTGIRSYIKNGTMTGNNSGFSNDSAQMLFDQGGAPAVDAAASYGNVEARRMGLDTPYQTGGVAARAYDPSNLDDQVGLNRRLMSVAALKGDYNSMLAMQEKNRDLADTKIFNDAVKQFSTNPESFTAYTRWINKTNPMITAAPARDSRTGQLTGYNIMTVGPTGDAVHKFISPQQAATLAGATALMKTNPTKALQLIASVDQGLAQTIGLLNQANEKVATTNNSATHFANEDVSSRITANAHATIAGAAVARAKRENQTEGQKVQEKIDAYSGILRRQNPQLSKEEADKKAADIIMRDPNAKEQDVGLEGAGLFKHNGKVYRTGKNGQPEEVKFPGEDATTAALKRLAQGGKDPFASGSDTKKPVIVRDNRPSATVPGQEMIGPPENFMRVSKRGALGGVTYVYRDPVSGREFSPEQYNQLLTQ